MKKNLIELLIPGLILVLAVMSCNLQSATATAPATETEAPAEPVVPVSSATPTAILPAVTSSPTETTPVVEHTNIPGELPAERVSNAGDHDSSVTADQKRAPGGDRFTFGRYERPFNANTMDTYFPYLDIQDTQIYQDDFWIFATITLEGGDENQELAGRYGFEIDADLDGGGDWLILVDNPSSIDWSTEGVQVWFDSNDDVGGISKINADKNLQEGDGYETVLFDSDQGDDPDLAWARISPDDPNTVQLAVKRSLLEGDDSFMTGMWAGNDLLDPGMFDLNDQFNHEQAGAALIELEYFYPIKAISEIDNSCRVPVGFAPTGAEPGICPVAAPPEEGGCPPQNLVCYNFGAQQVCYCGGP